MNQFSNYLEKLGSNFLVSAMIPALALVVASILMFDPILHVAAAFQNPQGTPQLVGFGLIILLLTVIIGFTLTALNTYVLKIFEGYIIFPPIRFLYNRSLRTHQEKARTLLDRRESLRREYRHLSRFRNDNPALEQRLEEILDKHYLAASDYDQAYPANIDDVLPTQFGNTLRAAEDHALERYGFDGVTFWPRLVHVIPDGYKATIDSTRNELSFLVNMSILSVVFSFFCILAIFHAMGTTLVVSANTVIFGAFIFTVLKYLAAAAVGVASCGFFYSASIISLSSFTLTIRASFDLFRLDLLRKLELVRPTDSEQEFDTWANLNDWVVLGNQSLTRKKIVYRPETEQGG